MYKQEMYNSKYFKIVQFQVSVVPFHDPMTACWLCFTLYEILLVLINLP